MINPHVCSVCGTPCYYDGRCGDGPVLICECAEITLVYQDRFGSSEYTVSGAKPIPTREWFYKNYGRLD